MRRAVAATSMVATALLAVASEADTPSTVIERPPVVLDESWPEAFELLEPYRLDCMRSARMDGAEVEAARAAVDRCVTKRLLAAGELYRMLRRDFPVSITPEALSECVQHELRPDRALACLRRPR